jgi:mannopine transport system substrate-binding protein
MSVNRRELLIRSAGLGVLPLVGSAAFAQAPSKLEDSLIIRTTGGIFEQALKRNFFDPFAKATGVKVVPVAASYGEMMAKTAAMNAANNVEWDVISPQYYELEKLSQYLVDLGDCSAMPNVAKHGVANACGRYGVLYLIGGQVLTWSTDAFKDKKPTKWADLWDVKTFPGPRAMPNTGSPWANIIISLLADGVEPAKLFPLDLDRAFAKLDQLKPHVAVWWRTGNQSQQVWRAGDAVLGLMWSGTAYATKRAGVPIEWTYDNAVADFGSWGILKGAPHPNAARAFINFYMANPEAHAAFAREMGYATSNKESLSLLSEEVKKDLVSNPETLQQIINLDADWLEKHRASTLDRWNKWLSA